MSSIVTKKIGITLGDFNGIGPEVVIKMLNKIKPSKEEVVILGSRFVLDYHKNLTGENLQIDYPIIECSDEKDIKIGSGNSKSAGIFSFQTLKTACEMANRKEINAILTAPVSKNSLNLAGFKYNGQTEIVAKFNSNRDQKPNMLFVADKFKVMLLTRHIPLKDVPKSLNEEMIFENIYMLDQTLKKLFKIKTPKIAICAMNPHAGENGLLGMEEKDYFQKAIKKLKKASIDVSDCAKPSDSIFSCKNRKKFDCFVACYHDQGLIPMKLLYPHNNVNLTIGLDILRASPSFGTAFDIAGKNIANPTSIICAYKLLKTLI